MKGLSAMCIYSPTNPPKDYYVYAYVREDGTPYYIGKGLGARAWNHSKKYDVTPTPQDFNKIIIMEASLSEIGAFALERRYIRWYGRKDNGSGILRNFTDGGEGASGRVVNQHTKTKISNKLKGKPLSTEHLAKRIASQTGLKRSNDFKKKLSELTKGRKHSEETKNKIKEIMTGQIRGKYKPRSEEHATKIAESLLGKKQSDEHRLAKSQGMKESWARRKANKK